jgi:aminoglycoside phosphotransferase (APT) family kinase protein
LENQGSATPEMLRRRAMALSRAGVPTPVARYDPAHNELVFPWIDGVTGEAYLCRQLEWVAAGGPHDLPRAVWRRLIAPLVGLHGLDPSDIDIQPLDPWRKIRPRIEAVRARCGRPALFTGRVEACASHCARALETAARHAGSIATVVHGDYHLGQLLLEEDPRTPWLLDLDDLALGPRESDLGNFAAHLATTPGVYGDCSMQKFSAALAASRDAYQGAGGRTTDMRLLLAQGAVALLRRALKGWERDDDRNKAASILAVAHTAAKGAEGAQ